MRLPLPGDPLSRLLPLLLLLATACDPDADGDGSARSEDCDDTNAARFPGNVEICDDLDNDCDGSVDEEATDRIESFADIDKDTFGDPDRTSFACVVPPGYVTNSDDCNDTTADVSPDALEICNGGVDDDCDGLADDDDDSTDLSTGSTFYRDLDSDGYGDPNNAVQACEQPADGTVDDQDCDDGDATSFPGATEVCDGADNDCDGEADLGLLGSEPLCAATLCADVEGDGAPPTDGMYWIDPLNDVPFEAWCDHTTDGGGWTLISWTNDSTLITDAGYQAGVPYPGLNVCPTLDCDYGSAAAAPALQAILQSAYELAAAHHTEPVETVKIMASMEYATAYLYDDLSGLELVDEISWDCTAEPLTTGRSRVLVGPMDYDDVEVALPVGLVYASSSINEDSRYIWNVAGEVDVCRAGGFPPAVYLGSSFGSREYGPYLESSSGARTVWAR